MRRAVKLAIKKQDRIKPHKLLLWEVVTVLEKELLLMQVGLLFLLILVLCCVSATDNLRTIPKITINIMLVLTLLCQGKKHQYLTT